MSRPPDVPHVPILFELGVSPDNFLSKLANTKRESKSDQQHILQTAVGWYHILLTDAYRITLWQRLTEHNDCQTSSASSTDATRIFRTDAWINLLELFRGWKLSPAPMLQAVMQVAQGMSMVPDHARSALASVDDKLSILNRWASLIDSPFVGNRAHLYVAMGIIRIMWELDCDPMISSCTSKMMQTASDAGAEGDWLKQVENEVSGAASQESDLEPTPQQMIRNINTMSWLQSMQHGVHMLQKYTRGGRGQARRDMMSMRPLLLMAYTQCCKPQLSIHFKRAKESIRKAAGRLQQRISEDATISEEEAARLNQEHKEKSDTKLIDAGKKGESWAEEEKTRRTQQFDELVMLSI